MLPNITVCPEIKIKLRQKIIPPNLQRCTGAVSTKVIRIYEELKIKCQPVAINSGYVWPKKGKKYTHKTITISILEPLAAGLEKKDFIKILENNIYKELDLLN